jgi:hypothetical protein
VTKGYDERTAHSFPLCKSGAHSLNAGSTQAIVVLVAMSAACLLSSASAFTAVVGDALIALCAQCTVCKLVIVAAEALFTRVALASNILKKKRGRVSTVYALDRRNLSVHPPCSILDRRPFCLRSSRSHSSESSIDYLLHIAGQVEDIQGRLVLPLGRSMMLELRVLGRVPPRQICLLSASSLRAV